MARGTTLVKLMSMYRAECKMSFNPAHNNQDRDRQIDHIQRVQEWLWDDFAWPMLRVERRLTMQAGQRYYDLPTDLHIDRINKVELFYNQAYCPLKAGIDAPQYTAYNSELDERQWPPQRWRISEDEQMEIWPVPDGNGDATTLEGTVKITGIRKLRNLVAYTDVADLDDRLIILFCASEYLASKGDKAADMKLSQANKRYARLRNEQSPARKFKLFGVGEPTRVERVPLAVYNKTS